jgi:hypothetical protein
MLRSTFGEGEVFPPFVWEVPASNCSQGTGYSDTVSLPVLNHIRQNARVIPPLPSMSVSVNNLLSTGCSTLHYSKLLTVPLLWLVIVSRVCWEAFISLPSYICHSSWYMKLHDQIQMNHQPECIWNQMNPVQTLPSCPFKINFNIFVHWFCGWQV